MFFADLFVIIYIETQQVRIFAIMVSLTEAWASGTNQRT